MQLKKFITEIKTTLFKFCTKREANIIIFTPLLNYQYAVFMWTTTLYKITYSK